MKKFIMTFLVAGLMITSVLSLSSCNKKETNPNANAEEWVPIVYNVVTPDMSQNLRDYEVCPYCGDSIVLCPHTLDWIDRAFYCPEHSHVHCFEATDNCDAPLFHNCRYRGVRKHYHILTRSVENWSWHGAHTGGGGCCEP